MGISINDAHQNRKDSEERQSNKENVEINAHHDDELNGGAQAGRENGHQAGDFKRVETDALFKPMVDNTSAQENVRGKTEEAAAETAEVRAEAEQHRDSSRPPTPARSRARPDALARARGGLRAARRRAPGAA